MSNPDDKYCSYCGTMIPYKDEYCPSCSKLLPIMPGMAPRLEKPKKKVWVAVLASLLLTGLGQVYIGEWRKGIAFFVGTFSIGFVLSYYFDYSTIMTLGTIMAIISALDAYRTLTK